MLRRTLALALLAGLLLVPSLVFADTCLGIGVRIEPFAKEEITVDGTVKTFTAATYAGAIYAYVSVEDATLRWYADGSTPSSSSGHPVQATTSSARVFELCGAQAISGWKATRTTGTSAKVTATFFRWKQ